MPAKPGTLVVNIGQAFEVVTDGVCKATTHRVLLSGGSRERYSVPFFQGVRRSLTKYEAQVLRPHFASFNAGVTEEPAEKLDSPPKVIVNDETDKPRVRKFNRFTPGPAAVHKLGHYGLCVKDFPAQLEWYTRTFNLAPTDFLYVPDGEEKTKDVSVFAHIDRGDDPVDHHTFFMSTNPTSHVHHCSFEVHDYDTQHLGHQWLGKKGYTSVWGIGRHILGSQ